MITCLDDHPLHPFLYRLLTKFILVLTKLFLFLKSKYLSIQPFVSLFIDLLNYMFHNWFNNPQSFFMHLCTNSSMNLLFLILIIRYSYFSKYSLLITCFCFYHKFVYPSTHSSNHPLLSILLSIHSCIYPSTLYLSGP